jgi:hypothetical protein
MPVLSKKTMKKKSTKKPAKVTKKEVKKAILSDLKRKGVKPEWIKSHLIIM